MRIRGLVLKIIFKKALLLKIIFLDTCINQVFGFVIDLLQNTRILLIFLLIY